MPVHDRFTGRPHARHGLLPGVALWLAMPLIGAAILTGCAGSRPAAAGADGARATGSPTGPPAAARSPGGSGVRGSDPAHSTGATPPMTGSIQLDGWRLTLPVDADGGLSGTAEQLGTAAVTAPWLIRNRDGSVTFWAPARGAKTVSSEHARTELVSTRDWMFGTDGVHRLTATLAVSQVPQEDPDICVGQVHGGGSIKSVPFVMLHYRDGSLVVVVKQELQGTASQSITLLTGIPLGGVFSYTITDNGDGTLGLSATYNRLTGAHTARVASAFIGTDQRFQVGDYQQATSAASATDGGRMTLYALNMS